MRRIIKAVLARFGYKLIRVQRSAPKPIDYDSYFNKLRKQIEGHTVVDKVRCFMIYQCAKQVSEIMGDVAEVGVYRGGTAKLLAKIFETKNKTVYLFDTFCGMPPVDPGIDVFKEESFNNTSLERVKVFLDGCKNVRYYKGIFPDTAASLENTSFCLVHIDVDIYKSAVDCCRFFYPRMEKGGIMIFDDYIDSNCPGIKKAVDEFFQDKPEKPIYPPVAQPDVPQTEQCIVIRL